MFSTIIHPETKQKINLFTKQGKNLLKNYIKLLNTNGGNSTKYSSNPISFVNLTDTNYSYNNQIQTYADLYNVPTKKLITERLHDRNVKCLKKTEEISLRDSNDKLSKLSFTPFTGIPPQPITIPPKNVIIHAQVLMCGSHSILIVCHINNWYLTKHNSNTKTLNQIFMDCFIEQKIEFACFEIGFSYKDNPRKTKLFIRDFTKVFYNSVKTNNPKVLFYLEDYKPRDNNKTFLSKLIKIVLNKISNVNFSRIGCRMSISKKWRIIHSYDYVVNNKFISNYLDDTPQCCNHFINKPRKYKRCQRNPFNFKPFGFSKKNNLYKNCNKSLITIEVLFNIIKRFEKHYFKYKMFVVSKNNKQHAAQCQTFISCIYEFLTGKKSLFQMWRI